MLLCDVTLIEINASQEIGVGYEQKSGDFILRNQFCVVVVFSGYLCALVSAAYCVLSFIFIY